MFVRKSITSVGLGICRSFGLPVTSSISKVSFQRQMHIKAIPMRWGKGDNYSYVVTDHETRKSWIIDPAEPDEVIPVLQKMDIRLHVIANTHHHHDHSSGNSTMMGLFPGLPLVGGKDSPYVTFTPEHGEVIHLGHHVEIQCLHTPCHTRDSISFYVKDTKTGQKALFSGDTLFTSGCGRFFEGTGEDMNHSLNEVIAKLPDDTLVYPGHEYTAGNVAFSKIALGDENKAIKQLEAFCDENEYTTGCFTIGDEKMFNPFMRTSDPNVIEFTGVKNPDDVVGALREMKNKF